MHKMSVSGTQYLMWNKRGAMIGNFMRMAKNSSNNELLNTSLKEKWRELKFLKYSNKSIIEAISIAKNKFPQFDWEHGH